jgi:hypothetical protein
MASPVEPTALTDHRQEPVVETALKLTQELLRLRPKGTSSDQWLASIHGLAHTMSEVVVITGGSAGTAPTGCTFLPLFRGRVKVKPDGAECVKRSGIRRKKGSTSKELPEHTVHSPTPQDLLLLEQRPGETLRPFTQRFADLYF